MLDPLPIVPFLAPLNGEVHLPGSKSITCRAMILAALSSETIILQNALISEDTLIMAKVLEDLGFFVSVNPAKNTIAVEGQSGAIPKDQASLFVGNSGITARFIPSLLCLNPNGSYYLEGTAAMSRRPIEPLLTALEEIGAASITYHKERGHFPFSMNTKGIPGGTVTLDVSQTSQVLSSLLIVAPLAYSPFTIHISGARVSNPYVIMTLRLMEAFGQKHLPVERNSSFHFDQFAGYRYTEDTFFVEPDASAASYFLALLLVVGGALKFPNISLNHTLQGDILFAEVMKSLGLQFEADQGSFTAHSPANKTVNGIQVDFSSMTDTFPTLAAIAPLLNSPTEISGISHTQFKESNRMAAVTHELTKLGQRIVEEEDRIIIDPRPLRPSVIDTYDDHRIAMAFSVLGCYSLHKDDSPWIQIKEPTCTAKSFPDFYNTLNKLRS